MNLPEVLTNELIVAQQVRLIDSEGQQVGVVSNKDAIERARRAGLDLVMISDKSDPPVCKILDYGKYAYEQKKKAKELERNSRINSIEVKELRFTPTTAKHDIEIKVKQAKKFLAEGDKVKFVVKFTGREMAHTDLGKVILKDVLSTIGEVKVEKDITLSERTLQLIVAPVIKK